MKTRISTLLVLSVALSFGSSRTSAAANEKPADSVAHFAQIYPKSQMAEDVMPTLQSEVPADVYKFIQGKLTAAKITKLPSVKVNGEASLQIQFKGHVLAVDFLPNRQIRVNGKTLDLLSHEKLEDQWALILSALPKYDKVSALSLLESKAFAEDNAERLTGGVLMGTGAMGAAAGAGTMIVEGVTGAALGATGVGAVVMIASYFIWNNGTCIGMTKQRSACLRKKDDVDERVSKTKFAAVGLASHRARPACKPTHSKEDEEFTDTLSDLVANNG
jgi:hypothetical protein